MNRIKKILIIASLIAANVVLSRFLSIRTPIITIGFGFIPLVLAGIILGYKEAMLIGIIADIIGGLLFPVGPFFIGYTISNGLTGLVYGLLLYTKDFKLDKKFIIKLVISVLIVNLIINGCLNTFWIILTTDKAVTFFAPLRWIKQLIMIPVKIGTILVISKYFKKQIEELKNA